MSTPTAAPSVVPRPFVKMPTVEICKSVLLGVVCKFGSRCRNVHPSNSDEEVKIKREYAAKGSKDNRICSFGPTCHNTKCPCLHRASAPAKEQKHTPHSRKSRSVRPPTVRPPPTTDQTVNMYLKVKSRMIDAQNRLSSVLKVFHSEDIKNKIDILTSKRALAEQQLIAIIDQMDQVLKDLKMPVSPDSSEPEETDTTEPTLDSSSVDDESSTTPL
jgi:hypothetical protein